MQAAAVDDADEVEGDDNGADEDDDNAFPTLSHDEIKARLSKTPGMPGIVQRTTPSDDGRGLASVTIKIRDGCFITIEGRAPPVYPGELVTAMCSGQPPPFSKTMSGWSLAAPGRVTPKLLPQSIDDMLAFLESGVIKRVADSHAIIQLLLLCEHYDVPEYEALEVHPTVAPETFVRSSSRACDERWSVCCGLEAVGCVRQTWLVQL
jgi:hypothetical protein